MQKSIVVVATVVVAKEVLRSGAVEQCGAACVTDECANREALAKDTAAREGAQQNPRR